MRLAYGTNIDKGATTATEVWGGEGLNEGDGLEDVRKRGLKVPGEKTTKTEWGAG